MRVIIALFFLSLAPLARSADTLQKDLFAILSIPQQELSKSLKSSQESLQIEVQSNDQRVASHALLALWLLSDSQQQVELVWWKSKSPLLRTIAAALLLTGSGENVANTPFLDATRFNEKENRERTHELKLVEDEGNTIGSALKELIDKTYEINPNEWKSALRLKFSVFH